MAPPRFGSLTVGARVMWRQLSSAPAAVVTIFVATLLTALMASGAPRLLEKVSADDLHESLVSATPEQRNLRADTQARLGSGRQDDLFSTVRERGTAILEDGFPEPVRAIVADIGFTVETAQFRVSSFPDGEEGPFPTFFRFRHQEEIEREITVVEGAMPVRRDPITMLTGTECPEERPVEVFQPTPGVDCAPMEVPLFETAITAETAEAMLLQPGDRVILTPDAQDRLWFPEVIGAPIVYVLEISGIVELSDLSNEIWFADPALHRPRIVENPDFRLIYATGVMGPDDYPRILIEVPEAALRYSWRYFVDPAMVDVKRAQSLRADIDKIITPNRESVATLLPALLTEFLEQRSLTVRLMSIAAAGLAVVGVGVILVLAALISQRHARNTVLIRDRGASRGQLALTAAYTGLLFLVPATLLGFVVTGLAFAESHALAPGRGSALVAAAGTVAAVVATSPYAFRRLGALRRVDGPRPLSSGGRVVLEVFVLVAAVAAVVLLRRRGQADESSGDADFDLLLALAPSLLGVAVGIVALRLLPPLTRGLSWLAGQGRALVAFIGVRRLVTLPETGRGPTMVILLAVAIAVFSSTVRSSIAQGQEEHGWQLVGADFRVDGGGPGVIVPRDIDTSDLAATWAEAALIPEVNVADPMGSPAVTLLAIDAAAYREVTAGAPFDGTLLDHLADQGDRLGVVVSSRWFPEGTPQPGTELTLDLASVDPEVVVMDVVDAFPSLQAPFVVVDLDALRRATGNIGVPATSIYLRPAESETRRIEEALQEATGSPRLVSRHAIEGGLAEDPFALWVDRGLGIVLYTCIAFAVVAAVSLLTVTSQARRRDLGYLLTLGLKSGQARRITAIEQIPLVVLATLGGAATGLGLARLLAPALDIESFTGGLLPADIVTEPVPILVLTLMIIAVLGLAVVMFVATAGAQDTGQVLRVGDE